MPYKSLFRDARLNLGVVKWLGFEYTPNSPLSHLAPRHATGDFFVVHGHVFEHGGSAYV